MKNQHNTNITLKEKLLGFIIMFSIALINFFIPQTCYYNCKEYLKEDILPLIVCGLIFEKYHDKKNHNAKILSYLEDNEEILFPIDIGYALHLWNAIKVGDSIFKEAGSDTVIIKHHKNNSYMIYKLECRFGEFYEKKKDHQVP